MITQYMPEMQTYVDDKGFEPVCDYVTWAYTESIDLKEEVEAKTPLETMYNTCRAASKVLA